jgi:hypothetical protein
MRTLFIAALLALTVTLSSAGSGSEPGQGSHAPLPDVPLLEMKNTVEYQANEAIDRLKAEGIVGLCKVAFAEGKTVNNPADRAGAEVHFQRLRDAMLARHGKPTGEIEFIRKEMVGKTLMRFTYLEKLEKAPVLWQFVFYRVGGVWKWKDLGVSDNFEAEYRIER